MSVSRSALAGLATSVAAVATVTLILFPLSVLDPGVSSGVLYVLGVLLVASRWGFALGVVTSAMSALALDFFYANPRASFDGDAAGDLVAVFVMFFTGVVASLIADRTRLREIQASRARVVTAADEERRRLVRDLHDGAQQGMVHAVVTLKMARRAIEQRDARAEALVAEALGHAQRATAELRELGHGILPSALSNGGLEAGIGALVKRAPIPVEANIAAGRFPPPVEATAYFVIAEALTNVAKHANARTAAVTVSRDAGALRVEVCDDGRGGAAPTGSGLLGLSDRLGALGGLLAVDSRPGAGTRVRATIPLAPLVGQVAEVRQHGKDAPVPARRLP